MKRRADSSAPGMMGTGRIMATGPATERVMAYARSCSPSSAMRAKILVAETCTFGGKSRDRSERGKVTGEKQHIPSPEQRADFPGQPRVRFARGAQGAAHAEE